MRTMPQFWPWDDWCKAIERTGTACYYGITLPRHVGPDAWLYIIWRGQVRGMQQIREVERFKHPIPLETWLGPNGEKDEPMMTRGMIVCDGIVIPPPCPIKARGFQGFRYTASLW
jgi:hypothetical protein